MTSKIRLLFVDDEELMRKLFCTGIGNQTLLIETAADGEEALRKLKVFQLTL